MRIDVRDDRLWTLLPDRPAAEKLAGGFVFTEGPVWNPEGHLLFSDVVGNARYRWDESRGAQQVAAPTGHGNGMTFDENGRLIVCESTGAIVSMEPTGQGNERRVLASDFEGRALNSPNDVVVASDGSVYFTDPWTRDRVEERAGFDCGASLERELGHAGVYRLSAASGLELLVADIEYPNGLCFSPDESLLYVNDTASGDIFAFEVGSGGALGSRRVLAEGVRDDVAHVDGMKCDERGNVWVTGPGGIWVLDEEGSHLGTLRFPERVGNFHWGGPEWRALYVTDSTSVYRVTTAVAGRREPFMT